MAHISNAPSFRLDRKASAKVQLEYIGNLTREIAPKRSIVVAASLTAASETSLAWVIDNLAREGDAIHVCHVCKCLEDPTEIYISGPGNSFKVNDLHGKHHEHEDVVKAQHRIKERLVPLLEHAKVMYEVLIFVDTLAAPPDAVGSTVLQEASAYNACALVIAANDGVADLEAGTDPQRLGSVAKWLSEQRAQPVPIVIVRNAKGQPPSDVSR